MFTIWNKVGGRNAWAAEIIVDGRKVGRLISLRDSDGLHVIRVRDFKTNKVLAEIVGQRGQTFGYDFVHDFAAEAVGVRLIR